MARNEQLIRQHKILQFLESLRYGATLEEIRTCLLDELGLSSLHQRTVRRDIEALQQAGFDIHGADADRGRVWKVGESVRKGFQLNASATEMVALSLARDLLIPLAGTPYWQGIESFWSKVIQQLPASIADHYERHRNTLLVLGAAPKDYADKLGPLKTLQRGISEHRRVAIEYSAPNKASASRQLEPYATILFLSSIYIVAADADLPADSNRLRHWKLDRIDKAELLDSWFDLPDDLHTELALTSEVGMFAGEPALEYQIRLRPSTAQRIKEDPWSTTQLLEELDDGDYLLTINAHHPAEIFPRVFSLGAECELLAPESARQEFRRITALMAELYAQ